MSNYRSGYLSQGQGMPTLGLNVQLVDGYVVNPMGPPPVSTVYLSSTATEAGACVFTLVSSTIVGHTITLMLVSGGGTTCKLASGSNLQLTQDWQPILNQTLVIQWNGSSWVELSRSQPVLQLTGTLSQADILAMNATPIELVPAPGAGKAIIVDEVELLHSYSTTAYAAGEDVSVIYETTATALMVIDKAFVTGTSSLSTLVKPAIYVSTSTDTGFALSSNTNKAVQITNASTAFTGGAAANVIKYRIAYHVVTLLT